VDVHCARSETADRRKRGAIVPVASRPTEKGRRVAPPVRPAGKGGTGGGASRKNRNVWWTRPQRRGAMEMALASPAHEGEEGHFDSGDVTSIG